MDAKAIPFDLEELIERCIDDADFACEMLGMFAKAAEESMEGLEASLRSADAPAAAKFVHTLKGSCGNVALREARQLTIELEEQLRSSSIDKAAPMVGKLRRLVDEAVASIPSASVALQTKYGY